MKTSLALICGLVMVLAADPVFPVDATPLPPGVMAVPLVEITNDRDSSVSEIALMLDSQSDIRGLYIATRESAAAAPDQDKGQVIPLASIETAKGAVVGQGQGVKAILLRGKIPSNGGHCELVIRYLANGIFRHYKECKVVLHRVGPNEWELVNAYTRRTVHQINVETWALGISTLHNVCPVAKT